MVRARKAPVAAVSGLLFAAIVLTAVHRNSSPDRSFDKSAVAKKYATLPVNFVENKGQTDTRVKFYAQGSGFAFFLTAREAVFQFAAPAPRQTGMLTQVAGRSGTAGAILRLRFQDGNPNAVVTGEERAAGDVNYLRGDDPSRWQHGLSQYRHVAYRDLWPGIDLRLHEDSGRLKYEFRVRPGARVSDIRLAYEGADSLALDAAGGLMIGTEMGVLRDSAPVSYQQINGTRVPVGSRYHLKGSSYGFIADSYDANRELIIDPGLEYSTFLGGTSHEFGTGIAVDAAGNAYVVGVTQSPNFPTRAGSFDRTGSAGNDLDVFVTKINATGTALVFSTFLGGSNFEWGRGIALDAANNIYITGQTKSSNFPTTGGAFDTTFNVDTCPRCGIDQYDAFVTKLNAAGSNLVYSTYLGGFDLDDGMAIAVDTAGSAYVAGETGSSNFPTRAGSFSRVKSGAFDAFVTKLNPAGSSLVYSTFLGGSEVDFAQRIAIGKDGNNNAYVVGTTRSPNFPTTTGAFDTTANGEFDVFITRLNPSGSALVYSTYLGGSGMEGASGLAVDAEGTAYIGGGTPSGNFPVTAGAYGTVLQGSSDAFVTRLNAAGNGLIFSTLLGGSGSEAVSGLALDAAANIYLAGGTSSSDFQMTSTALDGTFNGGVTDAFVAKLNAGATALLYSTFLGGSDNEGAADIALDSTRSVYVTGQTMSANFPTTTGAFDRVWNGDPLIFWADAFIAKLTPEDGPGTTPVFGLSSVTANPSTLTGGSGSTGTVSMNTPASNHPVVEVFLTSSDPGVVSVPESVIIAPGASSASFDIATIHVETSVAVTITARYNGVSRTMTMSVLTPPPSPILTNLVMSPDTVTGGGSVTGAVVLSMAPWDGGFPVTLSSSHEKASTPASVTVAQGSQSAVFPITTGTVSAATVVTITATAGGVTKTASLTINPAGPPPPPPPQTATLTVTATGRSGIRVTSTPAGINVSVPNTGSASFNIGTSITLRVSDREAIWSGACSSGGRKERTCTFTLSGNSAVTANVQ